LKIELENQIKILNKANRYLNKNKNYYYDSSLNYLDCLEPNPGYGLIEYWNKGIKKIPLFFFLILKNFLISFYEYKFIKIANLMNYKFKNIIITWSKFDNFLKDGSYNDPYFNTNSKFNNNCIWFLIHIDHKIPKKISNNLVIIKKNSKKFNYIKLLFFFLNFWKIIINIKTIVHKHSEQTKIAQKIFNEFKYLLKKNINKIIMPYEGQPFQNLIIKKSEEYNKNIKTIGFVHNFPPPMPTNLIYRMGSPSKIIVNGVDQEYCLKKYLGWSKQNICLIESARFIYSKRKMSEKIFLSGYIKSADFIIKNLNKLKIICSDLNIRNFKIHNHPQKLKSKIHIDTSTKIKKFLKNYPEKYNFKNKKTSIFIGSTGAIIEALERDCLRVIQITEKNTMQIYSSFLYPNINIKVLDRNIFEYSLKKRKQLIRFGKKKDTFNKYLKV